MRITNFTNRFNKTSMHKYISLLNSCTLLSLKKIFNLFNFLSYFNRIFCCFYHFVSFNRDFHKFKRINNWYQYSHCNIYPIFFYKNLPILSNFIFQI